MNTASPTLLLLGASGFVGRHLAQAFSRAGLRVVGASRAAAGPVPACDLLDPAAVDRCLAAVRPDLVFNAAGSASVARSWERPAEVFAANATGVLNLLEAVARHAPAAHVTCLSSAAVYGEPGPERMPLGEEAPAVPVSPYGAGKAAMEAVCGQYARARGLPIAVVRAFSLIGPGQPAYSTASGLARQIAAAEREAPGAERAGAGPVRGAADRAGRGTVALRLGNPGAARDTTDVRDAARALVAVATQRLLGTYNLCSGRAPTVAELAAGLAAASALEVTTRVDPSLARPADPPLLLGDPSRLAAAGYAPQIPLERSLADLLAWWRQELGPAPSP